MNLQQKTSRVLCDKPRHSAAILTLFAITFLLYASTIRNGFIFSWDDYDYVVNNRFIQGFSFDNISAVFSRFFVGNYAPIHLLSYMLDYQLWGMNPAGYHFVNILLHALNGILLYWIFLKMEFSKLPALFGASLFVLHPVQVESVAWVAERKNLLSMLFFLLSLLTYIDYRQTSTGRVRYYVLSMVFLVCALLSKSAAVIFPAIIICYDYSYCRETRTLRLTDKIPFLLLALTASILTIMSQDTGSGGGMRGYPGGTPLTTVWTMIPVFLSYLKDLVYPFDLSPYYIVPIRKYIDGSVIISTITLACLAWLGVISVKRWPRLLFFYSIYILSLLPVMQIIPILTLKNDRYLYFPMIGVAGAFALLISELSKGGVRMRCIVVAAAVMVSIFFGSAAYYQSKIWKNSITLWQFALHQNPENMLAWLMLAKGHTRLGNSGEAITAITVYNKLKSKYGPLRGWEGTGS
jgi:hypothetical protein